MTSIPGGGGPAAAESRIVKVDDTKFQSEVIMSAVPVLVDFWAPWCGPCKMLGPVVEALAGDYGADELRVAKVNVDESPAVAGRYGIVSIPTLLVFKGGESIGKIVGFMPQPALKAKVDAIMAQAK